VSQQLLEVLDLSPQTQEQLEVEAAQRAKKGIG
jgi:hypothetical protein